MATFRMKKMATTHSESVVQKIVRTVVIDPPWSYRDRVNGENRGAVNHYETLSPHDIDRCFYQALRDLNLAVDDDAHLYNWCTNAFVVEAHQLARGWGFDPKTLLTWVKPQIGMGHYFRNTTEHVVFAVRGTLACKRKDVRTDFSAKRGEHSAKPDEFFTIVESMSPGPYLELFARRRRPGWYAWGNELQP